MVAVATFPARNARHPQTPGAAVNVPSRSMGEQRPAMLNSNVRLRKHHLLRQLLRRLLPAPHAMRAEAFLRSHRLALVHGMKQL